MKRIWVMDFFKVQYPPKFVQSSSSLYLIFGIIFVFLKQPQAV